MTPSELQPHQHLRLVELRRLHFREVSGPEASTLQARLHSCPECQSRLHSLEAEAAAFAEQVNVGVQSAEILQRLSRAPEPRSPWAWLRQPWVPGLLAAAAALLFLLPMTLSPETTGPSTRLKGGGGVALTMYVKDDSGVHPGPDGTRLTEGDQIQFRYAAAGHPYLFVISVDARGVVSALYPEVPTQSIKVQTEGTHVLDGSVILDDSVGPERIYAIFSSAPVAFSNIDAAVQSGLSGVSDVTDLPQLPLDAHDVVQSTVLIVKE